MGHATDSLCCDFHFSGTVRAFRKPHFCLSTRKMSDANKPPDRVSRYPSIPRVRGGGGAGVNTARRTSGIQLAAFLQQGDRANRSLATFTRGLTTVSVHRLIKKDTTQTRSEKPHKCDAYIKVLLQHSYFN